jgi:hypothetical protein
MFAEKATKPAATVPRQRSSTDVLGRVAAVVGRRGAPLDLHTHVAVAPGRGHDFGHVRVHVDDEAARSARDLGADAYTYGHHIVFAPGRYAPRTPSGLALLTHELRHVTRPAATVPAVPLRVDDPRSREEAYARGAGESRGQLALRAFAGPTPGVVYRQAAGGAAAMQVGSFQGRAKSLTIDRTGDYYRVTGVLWAFGSKASAAHAAEAQNTIRTFWTRAFPDGHAIECNVDVRYAATPPSGASTIEMKDMTGPSNVSRITGDMELNMTEPDALTWTVAHEFGHQVGLKDRYSEDWASRIFKGKRRTTPDPGYGHNLMSDPGGPLETSNVRDVGEENAPSSLTDDDQIRLWVSRHTVEEMARLSAATKISMLNTLLSGYIDNSDVAAAELIIVAVRPAEAAAVKGVLTRLMKSMLNRKQEDRIRRAMDLM